MTEVDGKVCGVITDRDICVALGTRNRVAGEITWSFLISAAQKSDSWFALPSAAAQNTPPR